MKMFHFQVSKLPEACILAAQSQMQAKNVNCLYSNSNVYEWFSMNDGHLCRDGKYDGDYEIWVALHANVSKMKTGL